MVRHIRISSESESEAEIVIRTALLKHLRDGDVVISGLRLHDHEYGDVEIDLLVLLPDVGVAVVEVKGGVVSFSQGKWWTTGRHGTVEINPSRQARQGLHSFRRFMHRQPEWTKGQIAGDWFMCFPWTDISTDADMGPEGRRETIFGRGEEGEVASRIWEFLSQQNLIHPASGWVEQVADIVQANHQVPITLEQRVVERMRSIEQLTQQQAAIVKMWRSNRFIEVVGGAGSGKTWLAVEQARQWSASGLRVAFLTYTKGVAEVVKKAFEAAPNKNRPAFIGTFHALGYEWGVTPDPGRSGISDHWTLELPVEYLKVVQQLDPGRKFDAVIVDEAQDFDDSWWEVILAMVRDPQTSRIATFRDDGQAVFAGRKGRPDLPMAVFDLDTNLRNGRQVVESFAPLTSRKMLITAGEGSPTRVIFAELDAIIETADDAVEQLVDREGWLPEHVALLTTKGRHPEHAVRQDADKDAYWQELWSTSDIFYGTVAGFKGLERPAVVLAVNGFHEHTNPKDVLYTGMSRAIDLLVLVGTEQTLTDVLGAKHLRRLIRRQEAVGNGTTT